MRKKLYRMTVLFLAFLMASCANPEPLLNEEDVSASAATSSEPREPVTYTLEAQEIPLSPELEDTWEWIVLDTREDQVLFAIQEKHSAEEEMYSYRLTREIGIYDVEQAYVTAQWEPETPGWYQAGALTGEGTACCAGAKDYEHVYPSEYVLVLLGQDQKALPDISCTVQELWALEDGTAVFSYVEPDGQFGVRAVSDGQVTDLLTWQTGDQTEPLGGGEMSVCGSEFGYVYADHGQCVLIRADRSGELDRQTLIPKKEKLDSCYLTREGMVACLSIDEDTDQFHRVLTLLSAREDAQRRSGEDGALYRMRFAGEFGLAVDYRFRLQLLRLEDGAVTCMSAPLPEPLKDMGESAVNLYAAGDHTFYLFYRKEQKLYRVTVN